MELIVCPAGVVRCVYGEAIDLRALGRPQIRRASAVEPDDAGAWWADLSPVGGPNLGPFAGRADAVAAELEWLAEHWLANLGRISNSRSVNEGTVRPDRDLDPVGSRRVPGPPLRSQARGGGGRAQQPERRARPCGRPAC